MHQIRKATPNDAHEAVRLLRDAADEILLFHPGSDTSEGAYPVLEQFYRLERGRYSYKNFLVCEDAGRVVGVLLSYGSQNPQEFDEPIMAHLRARGLDTEVVTEARPGELYIDTCAVAPEYRGQKIGKSLFAAAHERAQEMGLGVLSLLVDCNKRRNHDIYQRWGFADGATIRFYGHEYQYMTKEV